MTFTARRNTEDGFAASPCHEQRGLAVAQLFLNMSREWVWKEIFPFREEAKLQRPQLFFSTAGPKCWAADGGVFPFHCLPVLSCPAGSRPAPGAGVRGIARFNYKVSEMEEKKKILSTLPPLSPPQLCSACGGASGFMSPCESVNFFILTLLLTETL